MYVMITKFFPTVYTFIHVHMYVYTCIHVYMYDSSREECGGEVGNTIHYRKSKCLILWML